MTKIYTTFQVNSFNHLIFNHFWYLWYVLYYKQVDSIDYKIWAPFILSMVLKYVSNSNPAFNKNFFACRNVRATTSPLSVPKMIPSFSYGGTIFNKM